MGPGRFVFLAGLKRRPAPKFVDTTWTNRSTSSLFSEGHRPDSHCAGAAPAHTHNADTDIRRELSQPSDSSSRAPIYIVGAVVWPLAVGGGNGCNVAARMQAPQAIRIGGTHASGWRAARQCTSDRTDLCRHLPRAGCRHFRNGGGRFRAHRRSLTHTEIQSYRVSVIGPDDPWRLAPPSTLDHESASPEPGIRWVYPARQLPSALWWVRGSELEARDAEREIDASLALERHGLERDRAVRSAEKDVRTETRSDGRLARSTTVTPRQREPLDASARR